MTSPLANSLLRRGVARVIAELSLLTVCAVALLTGAMPASVASAVSETECATAANPVSCENAKTGTPRSEWTVQGSGDPTIQGYATAMSVNVGQTESFKINTPASAYHINILRLGYYGGDGARTVASNIKPTATLPQKQPACLTYESTGLIDCGNWGVSASWAVPSNAVSGVYVALLVRNDTGGESQIPFVVRNDASKSEILLQTSDATWQAYNAYGGNSLYTCTVSCPPGEPEAYKAAYAVSYNRPWDGSLVTDNGQSYLYYAEYQMMYWLEEQGYNVSYTSESEVGSNGALLKNHKIFMSSGHDEYWSNSQRASVEAAEAAGVNLAFFSGNEVFWKTRWAPSTEGSNTANRTLITYKETHFNSPVDPEDPSTWTGTWRDPRFSPPADGGRPESSLTGQYYRVNAGSSEIKVPFQYSGLRLWRNTAVAKLTTGKELTLAPGTDTLGYEWDETPDNGFRPAGELNASSTTVSGVEAFSDYGSNIATNSTVTHHLTLYKAPSGALVFGAGTVQWAWGLANVNAWEVSSTEPSDNPPDPNMEQATVNLLADMGAQPGTLNPELAPAAKSTDTTPPTSTITSPAPGAKLSDGSAVTITGTATDTGGGVVAGVEVSTDGGSTWHPATLSTPASASVTWSYAWAAAGVPSTTVESRAVDDSANLQTAASISGTAKSVSVSCPCSIFGSTATPKTADDGDPSSIEVGMKFTSESAGTITGVRFYKAAANTGTHIGSLWTASGTLLAQATFTSETTSGWQQVKFASPVSIAANTTYIAGYFAPNGHYAGDTAYFFTPPPVGGNTLNSPPLHAVAASDTSENGLYSYASTPTFPTSVYNDSNYWVDPVYMPPEAPGQVTGVKATAGAGSAAVSWTAPSTGGPASTYTVTPYIGATAQTATTVTGAPAETATTVLGLAAGTEYTFKVQASNATGSGAVSAASNGVTPTGGTGPSAPTAITANPATNQALVSWTAPSSTGGSAIAGYTITPFIGATAQTPISAGASATSVTVPGLTNGTSYTFTVAATNATAKGPASPPSAAVTPNDTIFNFTAPGIVDAEDPSSVELGVKFTSSVAGSVTGIRFYKAATNTGTHVGSLWSSTGTLLGSATFTNESASGWQLVTFSSPVAVSPGVTYVAGYFDPNGHYSATSQLFSKAGVESPPLVALANGTSTNGVYAYSSTSTFPSSTWESTSYSVDVMFAPAASGPATAPSAPGGVSATPANNQALVSWTAPNSGGSAITGYTITPYLGATAQTPVPAGASATSVTVPSLTNGSAYTFTVTATNAIGSSAPSAASAAVTPNDTIFNFAAPAVVDSGDTTAAELGVKFNSSVAGSVTGIRFYKATANTGTHVGGLWTASGTLLASATFTNESASGWQLVTFSSPVAIIAGTTYVAGYFAPAGHYSATVEMFSKVGLENPPLTALANSTSPNGVYKYSSASAFPSSSFQATNYGVDVLFAPSAGGGSATAPTAPTGVSAAPANNQALVSWTTPGNGGSAITGYTITPYIGATAQTPVSAGATATSVTVPSLANGTAYTFTVAASNAVGKGAASIASAAVTPNDTIFNFAVPTVVDSGDVNATELGVKFNSSVAGSVTGIRFYKAAANTGTHVGSLWTSGGTLLASATFTGESASGWQTVTFGTPVAIKAGSTYVAGYFAPVGHYSATVEMFSKAGLENPPLTALSNSTSPNGVYVYSAATKFPSSSFEATSYSVDVIFAASK